MGASLTSWVVEQARREELEASANGDEEIGGNGETRFEVLED